MQPKNASIRLRKITAADQYFIKDMVYLAIYVAPEEQAPDRSILEHPDIKKYYSGWGKAHDIGFIAEEKASGLKLGAIWMRCYERDNPGWGFVDERIPEISIAVKSDVRNQGIGMMLLDHLINYAASRYPGVSLSVDPRNPAMHLYQRFGFENCGEVGSSITMVRYF
ncbi:GNAT family N-acetyltransferase [candidate division KSB1 bacterium]|nr:GNAT family N-acetyltransferase [candidate division KSB1 bacterium]